MTEHDPSSSGWWHNFQERLKGKHASPRIVALSKKLGRYAHQPWVTVFFFLIFFLDSFLMVIPSDPVLALTVNFVPDRKREWILAAVGGALMGLLIFLFLTQTEFQPRVVEFIAERDISDTFQDIRSNAAKWGYLNITFGVFTIVPSIICLVGGIIVGLNPLIVFLIVAFARVFRLATIIWLFRGFWVVTVKSKHKIEEKIHKHRHEHDKESDKERE